MPLIKPAPIETERLTLRIMERRDLADLYNYYSDPQYLHYLPNVRWNDLADGEAWFQRLTARMDEGVMLQFVIEVKETGKVIGIALLFGLDEPSQRAELGYALGPAHWNRGYAGEAVGALVKHAFDDLGLRRLEAVLDPNNAASRKLAERLGFQHEGTLRERAMIQGRLVDSAQFGLLRREWKA